MRTVTFQTTLIQTEQLLWEGQGKNQFLYKFSNKFSSHLSISLVQSILVQENLSSVFKLIMKTKQKCLSTLSHMDQKNVGEHGDGFCPPPVTFDIVNL